MGRKGVTWLTFEILGPPPYLRNCWSYKLQIWYSDWPLAVLSKKMQNLFKRGREGSRDLLLVFWDPLHILGTVETRNFKFGMQIGHWAT